MPKPLRTYTRLTRRTASVASYQNLWLAADHILILTSTGYTEEYQRVRLRDIKGIFVTDSDRRLYWGLPWGVAAGITGLVMAGTLSDGKTPVVSGILFALSVFALLWNHLLGPGCRAYVVTGVQTALLPSLVRRGKTQKVIAQLEPLILAAQADLVPTLAAAPEMSPPVAPPL